MQKKITGWKTKGMNRDLSVSAFNSEFSFENRNLRLSTNDGNTLMSWVNEKGPKEIALHIDANPWRDDLGLEVAYSTVLEGTPIGTAVLNENLVVFTTDQGTDRIYVLQYSANSTSSNPSMEGKILYLGHLNFSPQHPLETLASYESTDIQKVYWTDGYNQPRFINIKASHDKLKIWHSNYKSGTIDTFFDFVPAVKNNSTIVVSKNYNGGVFAPGVIQYAFTYINKYGQQSNIVDISPLYYNSHSDRGASPEEKVNNSYNITIENVDTTFDFIRLYSIQRTSTDATPIIKILDDISLKDTIKKTETIIPDPIPGELQVTLDKITAQQYSDGGYTMLPEVLENNEKKYIKTNQVKGGTYSYLNRYGTSSFAPNIHGFHIICWATKPEHPTIQQNLFDNGQELIGYIIANSPRNIDINDYYASYYFAEWLLKRRAEEKITFPSGYTVNDYNLVYGVYVQPVAGETPTVYTQSLYRTIVYDYSNMVWCLQQNGTGPTITPNPTMIQPDPIEEVVPESVQYVDTGTTGSTMNATELLYVGGKDITALTMAEKDNTLFLGNITQFNYSLTSIQEYFDSIRDTASGIVINYNYDDNKAKQETLPTSVYSYSNNLNKNSTKITTFKGGETYRFGFQLQKATGEWSDPIYIDDVTNYSYPRVSLSDNKSELVSAYGTLNINTIQKHFNSGMDFYTLYKSIRPVIVFPSIQERSVLCQGVLNPTVFNVVDRKDNTPFAQASWYYRPYCLSRSAALTNYEPPTLPAISGVGKATDPTPFVQKNLMQNVYVLRLQVKSGVDAPTQAQLEKALSKGVITEDYANTSWDTDPDPNYLGYVPVTSESNTYLLFKSTHWVDPTTVSYIGHGIYGIHYTTHKDYTVGRRYQSWVETAIITEEAYRICSSIKAYNRSITSSGTTYPAGVLYYVQPADISTDTYIIKVRNGASHQESYYYISFAAYKNPHDFNIPVSSEAPYNQFTHYNTLPEDADIHTLPTNGYPEIQGAHNIINNVFGTTIDAHPTANNQYFVDQSIVTLNSPDIEFDSSISNVGTEGFKLRVVGVIPITSNVSSHSISASSAMEGLKVESSSQDYNTLKFGVGELGRNIQHNNLSMFAGTHLNSKYLWNDARLGKPKTDGDTKKQTVSSTSLADFAVYPWHRTGSLTNDLRKKDETSSLLKNKREAELLYSLETEYFPNKIEISDSRAVFNHIDFQIHQTENTQILNMKLKKQHEGAFDINYYPNIDKVLYNTNGYSIKGYDAANASPDFVWGLDNNTVDASYKAYDPVSMKYLSTSHAIITLQADDVDVPLLPYAQYTDGCDITVSTYPSGRTSNFNIGKYTQASSNTTYWGDTSLAFTQQGIPMNTLDSRFFDFLWLGEIYKEVDKDTMFGGRSDTALRANNWLIGGKSVSLDPNSRDENGNITLVWSEGDTYYQRYDSLKTYASTEEDTNSIIEILSFMCETRVNIDGRYDKNRAQQQNHNMRPQIFNVINPVYSQRNNYFTYKKLNEEGSEILKYPQYLTYSQPKTSGADIDLYTNVTMASVLELDGDSGSLNALERVNDRLIAFQDTGISQILYNENVQVSPEQGMPIEIANSGKVQGAKYISNTVGCSNKWSVANTPGGVYFIDSTSRSIYLFADSLMNLSAKAGMNSWVKQNLPKWNKVWNPETFDNFVTYYDKLNQEAMFINPETCLTFSEQISAFTSFYDYGNAPYFVNLGDTGIWLSKNNAENNSNYKLWQHNAGNYCNFFGVNKPYSLTLIGNPDPQMDKIFTNLEFRAIIEGDGSEINNNFSPYLPFNTLEVWNEYQHGIATLQDRNGHSAMRHHELNNTASLKRKFRMWRCDIPRDNAPLNTDASRGVSRTRVHPIDRMRNPWLYLKLQKEAQANMPKAEIHDLLMTYFD